MSREVILLALGALLASASVAQTSDTWKLVWSDEFDQDGVARLVSVAVIDALEMIDVQHEQA